ncbi:unnamed protein product [Protopolystoma xenopodis]|uniref:Uncharacterized protein n=1 Tax=Protopolystoma xenopodis TaxID=117903 RepID=A0A448X4U6_9PLAT|nr:unnamed protein product [Protopolystoma xenopodis]
MPIYESFRPAFSNKLKDDVLTSRVVSGRESVYFGQRLVWPIGRRLEESEVLEICAYNHSKYLPDK